MACPTTRCSTRATRASDAGRAPAPRRPARPSARGGGAAPARPSAACTPSPSSRRGKAVSFETTPITAHGGTLVSRVIAGEEHPAALELAAALPSVTVDARTVADLELIATGADGPPAVFVGLAGYSRVAHELVLVRRLPWLVSMA